MGFTQRSLRLPSDSSTSHDVCVGVLLGAGSIKGIFEAKSPWFCNIIVKTPHFVVTEHEGIM